MTKRQIQKVFIANRGEICRRIASSAKTMGIATACVVQKNSKPQYLSSLIDELIYVEDENSQLYLSIEKMIGFAQQSQCDAIHPGFGFLSENADFAQTCHDAGLIWLGPGAPAIRAMASKQNARKIAQSLAVPCLPGLDHFSVDEHTGEFDEAALLEFTNKAEFPLIVKAAFGGGGKGMRLVYKYSDLKEAIKRAASEAKNSFGNGTLIIERYLPCSRHIEVQIIGDSHGHIYAIGDRDCSIQRRHQKVIEEAPAPGLNDNTRQALYACAIKLAKHVGYESLGTVEFILDWSETSQKSTEQSFYFLEMNTRLQVEHPVTEEVFNLDLVAWQFKIGQKEHLPNLELLQAQGHAIEARLYAEDPKNNFFPSPGKVKAFYPFSAPKIRWEIGIDGIDEISAKFDPMIGKVIAWGPDRASAIRRLSMALKESIFFGPPSNLGFLIHILDHSPFQETVQATSFIEKFGQKLLSFSDESINKLSHHAHLLLEELAKSQGSLARFQNSLQAESISTLTQRIFSKKPSSTKLQLEDLTSHNGEIRIIYEQSHLDKVHPLTPIILGCGESDSYRFHYGSWLSEKYHRVYAIMIDGMTYYKEQIPKQKYQQSLQSGAESSKHITAPVPGKIIKILVKKGETVQIDETVMILESMKMEFNIKSTKTGIIDQIMVNEGDQITQESLLVQFVP